MISTELSGLIGRNRSRREHTSVNNSQSPDTVNLQFLIHNAPILPSRHACSRGGMVQRARPLPHILLDLRRCGLVEMVVQCGVAIPGPVYYLACQRLSLNHPEECFDPPD